MDAEKRELQRKYINLAKGNELNNIGIAIGVPRNSDSDEKYRTRLLEEIDNDRT